MCLLMAADTAIAYGAEKAVARMFSWGLLPIGD
jgi:hypothetical protein